MYCTSTSPKWCMFLGFPTKILYAPLLSSNIPHAKPISFLLFDQPNNIYWAIQTIKLLTMISPPVPCYLVLLRPKNLPQCPILEHHWPTFLPQRGSTFTPTQNNRQNYSSVYINPYIIWYQTGTQKIWSIFFYECDFNLLWPFQNMWTLTTLPKVSAAQNNTKQNYANIYQYP